MTVLATLLLAATFSRSLERVTTLDPALSQSVYDARAIRLIYETVLDIDYTARPYRLAPGVCELPEVSADGLGYVFRLRAPSLTAQDVVRSLERLRDPQLLSPNGWVLKRVDTMIARDARTFEVRLKARCHFFPWLMAMPCSAVRTPSGDGTGPYALTSWRRNHEMVFTRRVPQDGVFNTVRYLVVDDVSTQWLMFLKGEIDFLGEISRDNWDAVMGKDGRLDPVLEAQGVRLHAIPTLDTLYIGANMRDPVLGPNRKLRQALNAAFDSAAWEAFYSGRVIPADGPLPPGVDGRLDAPFAYRFDLDKARRLMTEAGYPGGIDPKTGRRLILTMAIGRASQDSRESGELLAAFFARIGVKLELSFFTWDAFLKAVNESRVQLYRLGWVGDYPDAENFLQLFYSKNISPGPNHSNYVNPDYDKAYDAAMAAPTEHERNKYWKVCQEIVREDCPWIFIHYKKSNSLIRARVGNYVPSIFPYGQESYLRVRQ
jgi:ABC-type transport system substrate-binding protein